MSLLTHASTYTQIYYQLPYYTIQCRSIANQEDSTKKKVNMYVSCEKCGNIENDHKQRHITYKKIEACVDEELAEVILFCWKKNIETQFSCIGTDCNCTDNFCDQESTQILFWQAKDLERFILLIREESFKDNLLELCFEEPFNSKKFDIIKFIAEDTLTYKSKRDIKIAYTMLGKIPISNLNKDGKIEGHSIPSEKHRNYIRWCFNMNRDMIKRLNRVVSSNVNLDMSILVKNADKSNFGLLVSRNGKLSFYGGFKNGIDYSMDFQRKSVTDASANYPGLDIEKVFLKLKDSQEKYLKKIAKPGMDLLYIIRCLKSQGLLKEYNSDGSWKDAEKSIHILREDELPTDKEISEFNFYYNNWQDEGMEAKYFFSK